MTATVMRWTAVVGGLTALVLGLFLWSAGANQLARAATPRIAPPVTLPATAPITEIGPLNASSYGSPLAVDDSGDVLYPGTVSYNSASGPSGQPGGIWRDGAFVSAPTPSGAILASPVDMNDDGLVAGGATASFPGFTGSEGYYWDTVTGDASVAPVVAPSMGCAEEAGSLTAVDDTGEAGGSEGNVGDDPDCGSNVVAAGPGDAMEPISGSPYVEAIQPDWELVDPDGGANYTNWSRVDRTDGSTTPIPFAPTGGSGAAIQNALAPDGSVVGSAPGGGVPEIMLPDGTVQALPVPTGDTGEATAINDSGEIVGEIKGRGVLWTSYTAQPINLNAILPLSSGWVLGGAIAISAQGNVLGFGTLNGASATYVLHTGQTEVSGTVNGVSCSDSGCAPVDASGFAVVVQGTAANGQPAGSSALTKSDGTWTVYVPPGNYTAGISSDGSTIASPAFEQEVTVGSTAVTGVNFTLCTQSMDTSSSALASDVPGPLPDLRPDPFSRAHVAAAATFSPSYCKSEYTLRLSAQIPQKQIVDFSPDAPYNSSTAAAEPDYPAPGFLAGSLGRHLYGRLLDSILEVYPKYPACLSLPKLEAFADERVKVSWYTYLSGGQLGKITIPLIWNQNRGPNADPEQAVTFDPDDVTSSSNGSLTRVWKYVVERPGGRSAYFSCKVTAPITPRYYVVPGGSDNDGRVDPTSFTVLAFWYVPFTPESAVVPPGTTIESWEAKIFGEESAHEFVEHWEHAPFIPKFVVSLLIAEGVTKSFEAGLKVASAVAAGLHATAKQIKILTNAESIPKALHNLHTIYDLEGEANGLADLLDPKESYPVMGAVIRGQFTTTQFIDNKSDSEEIPARETLGLSMTATKFPDISLKITRNALGPQGVSKNPVWIGALPWANGSWNYVNAQPATANPFASNPTYLIAQTTTPYARGESAVDSVLADTSPLKSIDPALIRSGGDLNAKFSSEQALADPPDCSTTGVPGGPNAASTICWEFEDGRP